jgi:hypothetical protein
MQVGDFVKWKPESDSEYSRPKKPMYEPPDKHFTRMLIGMDAYKRCWNKED